MLRRIHLGQSALAVVWLALLAAPVRTDDFKLKDGSKISGTIVGFDDSSFKVQTSYGFALVRKDQIVSITMGSATIGSATVASAVSTPGSGAATGDEPKSAPEKKTTTINGTKEAVKTETATAESAAKPAVVKASKGAAATPIAPPAKPALNTAPAAASVRPAVPMARPAAPPVSAAVAAPVVASAPATPPSRPPEPPAAVTPEAIRENVNGNTYTNETYGFQMYKPPSWQVIPGAQTLLPGAIAAMGNLDQTTYLLIGREPAGKSLTSDIAATDQRLRGMMDNFRPQGDSRMSVSGTQAVEQQFRGSVDDKEWSGTVVFVPHGGQLYTIFAMTAADTDLVQIQENVIARAISSLQFGQ